MSAFSHLVHIVLCFLTGLLWIPIYIVCIISSSNSRKKADRKAQQEQTDLLRKIAEQNKYRGYRD
jgi:hypothetical protein